MPDINTEYLKKCIDTLQKSYELLKTAQTGSVDYEVYRNSLVKGFEMTIEQSGKLLRKKITPFLSSKRAADELAFKDIFRHAHKYSLLTEEETKRWFEYRDILNTADLLYSFNFPSSGGVPVRAGWFQFIKDAEHLKEIIDND